MVFDNQAFKSIMSRWASGISVITTNHEGEWQGFTANSFASVSINPLLVSMSVAKTLRAGDLIINSGNFIVNILTTKQEELGKLFAGMYKDRVNRFEGFEITLGQNQCPILPEILAHMECTVYKTIDVGASTLILGEVKNGAWREEGDPLLYYQRQWGYFSPNNS
jgi:flavin reductase (DIM6/NTAB) family NADH-FMN oxidoreductase RutF